MLKATKVDGIYDADPKKVKGAKRFEELTYDEVIQRNLQVMDTAAFALCRDNRMPLRIYDMMQPGDADADPARRAARHAGGHASPATA